MLSIEEAELFVGSYLLRRRFKPNETEHDSLMVILFNFGDHLTEVTCINGEWRGIKGDLPRGIGIPLCPNNHPLLESWTSKRLELVDQTNE